MPSIMIAVAIAALVFTADPALAEGPAEALRITPKELMAKLDGGERVIVIDMRVGGSYSRSPIRIKGDLRIELPEIAKRAGELPMGWDIVTYCT